MAYIGAEPVPGQNREVDDISSGFNGNATAFTLQVSSVNVSPESANNILVNLGGVLQNPGTDYTVAASTLTFTTAPAAGLSFFGLILGAGINTATVADDTIGASKLIDTAVTAGSYTTADITVDAQGRITAAANGTIATAEIADGAVTNAKVNASAAIAGTKISPDFGSQAISTTNDSVTIGDSIIHSGDTNTKIRFPAADTVSVETAGSEAARFDSSGRLLIGTDSARSSGGSVNAHLQLEGTNSQEAEFLITRNSADTFAPILGLVKTRGTSVGSTTTVADNDILGLIQFRGADGSDIFSVGASIFARVNGTPSDGTDMPGELVFATTADGASSPSERMYISSSGNVGIGVTPTNILTVQGSSHSKILIGTTGTSHATGLQISHAIGSGTLQEWQLQTDGSVDGNLVIRNATSGNKIMIFDADVYGVSIGGIDPDKMFELQGSNNGITDAKSSINTLRFRCNDSTTTNNQPMGTILWTTNDSGNSSGNAGFISTIDADQTGNGILVFGAGNEAAEKMRLDGNGRFYVGTTGVGGGLGGVRLRNPDQGTSRFGSASSGQITYIQFINNNGNTVTGSISGNASSTSYNTSSDYRLKENESPISDGITRLKQLKPYKFNWKSDSSTIVDGFFAHEVSSIVPESITGTKDAVAVQDDVEKGIAEAIGEPIYQSIDHAKLVPLLTAALQEAVAKIETLETKVAALEAA